MGDVKSCAEARTIEFYRSREGLHNICISDGALANRNELQFKAMVWRLHTKQGRGFDIVV